MRIALIGVGSRDLVVSPGASAPPGLRITFDVEAQRHAF